MATINKQGDWLNRNGKFIPVENIQPKFKKRDAVVTKIVERAIKLQDRMIKDKKDFILMGVAYLMYLEKKHGIKDKKIEGNLTLSDYANTLQVKLSVNNMITFDEELNVAKKLIDECLRKWTKNSSVNLRSIVDEAFNIDKKGRVNTWMILRLTRLKINNKVWKRAMQMIIDSMEISGTRQYFTFKYRKDKDSLWKSLNLNFSSLQFK